MLLFGWFRCTQQRCKQRENNCTDINKRRKRHNRSICGNGIKRRNKEWDNNKREHERKENANRYSDPAKPQDLSSDDPLDLSGCCSKGFEQSLKPHITGDRNIQDIVNQQIPGKNQEHRNSAQGKQGGYFLSFTCIVELHRCNRLIFR